MEPDPVIQMRQMQELIHSMKASISEKDKLISDLMEEIKGLRLSMNKILDEVAFLRIEKERNDNPNKGKSPEYKNQSDLNSDDPLDKGEENKMEADCSSVGFSDEDRMSGDYQEVVKRKYRKKRRVLSSSEDEVSVKRNAGKSNNINNTKNNKNTETRQVNKRTRQVGQEDFPALPSTSSAGDVPPVVLTKATKIVPRPTKTKAIPPIVVSNAGKFVSIANLFRTNNVKYTSAIVVRNGIKVFPCTADDFRRATQLLEKNKEPFFTFRFPEEKLNHVVLRGVPTHLATDDVKADLERQGFSPKKVIRWLHANKNPMPMVLVLLPKTEKDIFKVRLVCTFEVRAEAQKSKARSIQCYNCQDHGHAAPCCHIPAKCVKCGKDHRTSDCTKAREEPPKCANCAGDHPASFSGCPRHPSQIRTVKQSNFRGWGTQDNSRLAPSKPEKPQKQVPRPAAANESLLSQAQLAQIAKMFADQLKSFMTLTLNNARK